MRNKLFCSVAIFLSLLIISCQNSSTPSSTSETKPVANLSEKTSLKVSEVIEAMKKAGLPVEKEIIYSAENDPNKLLGRPNQYIEKANWADNRIKQNSLGNLQGGTVEAFDSKETLENRRKYVEEIGKASPLFAQYQYSHKNILIRLEKDLTPEQAAEYEKVIKGL